MQRLVLFRKPQANSSRKIWSSSIGDRNDACQYPMLRTSRLISNTWSSPDSSAYVPGCIIHMQSCRAKRSCYTDWVAYASLMRAANKMVWCCRVTLVKDHLESLHHQRARIPDLVLWSPHCICVSKYLSSQHQANIHITRKTKSYYLGRLPHTCSSPWLDTNHGTRYWYE